MQHVANFNLFWLWNRNKICMISPDIFAIFFDGSKTLLVLAKWMFVNTMPNYHSVQTLVQGILVCTTLNFWIVCIWSLLYTWNLCCFHLSTLALHCFAKATRQKEHISWITLQVQLHICANLFQQCDQVSTCTEHFCCMHEVEHSHLAWMLCRVKSPTPKFNFVFCRVKVCLTKLELLIYWPFIINCNFFVFTNIHILSIGIHG
jgi:hypothetical protein